MRLVVCEDDEVVRSLVTALAEEHGHRVIAETDNASDAVRLIERFDADALILDLSLKVGHGRQVLAELSGTSDRPVVVFTSFGEGLDDLDPNVEVVDKPDFGALAASLERLARTEASGADRRSPLSRPSAIPPRDTHASHDAPDQFYQALRLAQPGDSLVAFAAGRESFDSTVDVVMHAARRLIRVQDRLLRQPSCVVLLLVGGSPAAPASVTTRLRAQIDTGGPLWVATSMLKPGDEPAEVFLRVTRQLRRVADGEVFAARPGT